MFIYNFFFLISDFLADISSMEIPPVTADELEDIGMKEVKKNVGAR